MKTSNGILTPLVAIGFIFSLLITSCKKSEGERRGERQERITFHRKAGACLVLFYDGNAAAMVAVPCPSLTAPAEQPE